MSEVEIARFSSKGQVVIPLGIRREVGVSEGSVVAVFGSGDSIVLKRVQAPSRQELAKRLDEVVAWGEAHAKKLGLREEDVVGMVHRRRGAKSD